MQDVLTVLTAQPDPFDYLAGQSLCKFFSGFVALEDVANDLSQAYQTGEKQFLKFCEDQFKSEEVGFFDSLPSQKLKTFSVMNQV